LTAESAWEEGLRPWVVLIASDERITRFRHPIATDKKVRQSAMIVVCAERYGLVCSATRLVSFGRVDADLKRRHEACCRVDAAFLAGSRPGRKLREVFADGQKAYAEAGYDGEWKLHHQGGLAGYLPREVIGTPTCETILPTSAALAWNPSITGTKSEDTVLSTSAGVEIITASKDWPMIRCEIGGQVFDRPAILER
jgi:antitoxin VapB